LLVSSERLISFDSAFTNMKKLELLIPHERLEAVNELLHKHSVGGMTCYDVKGRGRSKQESVDVERGTRSYIPELGPRTKIEVIVENTVAKRIIDDVLNVISTGSSYDGKIFVSDIAESYDIGTKAAGDAAL
jgi:nitrogen regulatory protein P-II 1